MSGQVRSKAWTWDRSINSPASPFSSVQRHVASVLANYMSSAGDSCWPSMPTLAADLDRATSTVRDALNVMTGWGWLEREIRPGRGHSNQYIAMIPEYFDRDATGEENRRRAVAFADAAAGDGSASGLPEALTDNHRTPAVSAEGENRRSDALKPPEPRAKTTGVRHLTNQDQSKDHKHLPTADADGERERVVEGIRWALTGELGSAPLTRSEQGAWGKVIAELADAGATADDVRARCAAYRLRWPAMALTPIALARHWSMLGGLVAIAAPEATVQGWVEKSGWLLPAEDAADILRGRGLAGADLDLALDRCREIREDRDAGDRLTTQALDEAAA